MVTKREKIKQIREIANVKTHLSWGELCKLTDFDSFATAFVFGIGWNENCPHNRLVTMSDAYINMILFNLKMFPKGATQ